MTPLYHWKEPGELEQQDLARVRKPEITEPTSPAPNAGEAEPTGERRFVCTVVGCEKEFKKAMIVARHFNSNHSDLRVDKDSWREFSREVWK